MHPLGTGVAGFAKKFDTRPTNARPQSQSLEPGVTRPESLAHKRILGEEKGKSYTTVCIAPRSEAGGEKRDKVTRGIGLEETKLRDDVGSDFNHLGPCLSTDIQYAGTAVHAPRVTRDRLPLDEETSPQHGHTLLHTDSGTDGLCPPRLVATNMLVTGSDKNLLRKQNKNLRVGLQQQQEMGTQWSECRGDYYIPDDLPTPVPHRNHMCPSGLARLHPAGDMLESWAQLGCPTMTGLPWSKEEMECAIAQGPHKSARSQAAIDHFAAEIKEKVAAGQARTLLWEDIKDNPPPS